MPYEFGKKTISSISASIRIADYPSHAIKLDELLKAADNAMYVAEKCGKDKFFIFSPPIRAEGHIRDIHLENSLTALQVGKILVPPTLGVF